MNKKENSKFELLLDDYFDDYATGKRLYRIRAKKSMGDPRFPKSYVPKGAIGGYVESSRNLAASGTCWIHDNAMVQGQTRIKGNTRVRGTAYIDINGEIHGNIDISGSANIRGYTTIKGNVTIEGGVAIDSAKINGTRSIRLRGNVSIDPGAYLKGKIYLDGFVNVGCTRVVSSPDEGISLFGAEEVYFRIFSNSDITTYSDKYFNDGGVITASTEGVLWVIRGNCGTFDEVMEKLKWHHDVTDEDIERYYKPIYEFHQNYFKDKKCES